MCSARGGIYKRKIVREKVGKHAFDQEKSKIQEKRKILKIFFFFYKFLPQLIGILDRCKRKDIEKMLRSLYAQNSNERSIKSFRYSFHKCQECLNI